MKFNIEKTCGISTVIGPSGLGQHKFHFFVSQHFLLHLFCQINSLIKVYTVGKRGPYIDGSFVKLWQKFSPVVYKSNYTEDQQGTKRAHRDFFMLCCPQERLK